ncbi:MAG TPA: glycosyltransferase family 4 protein [Thermoanaerobaculia bacterium]|nr:glycosyltransferase family 4 protein [Thermoanaerobaculia bacterium]
MKILLLAPHPFFQQRGTPIAERMLLEVLAGRGHQIDVLTFHEGEDVQIPGCRLRRIPALPFVHSIRGIQPGFSLKKLASDAVMLLTCLRMVRRDQYDVVHAVEESAFMGLAARWLFRVPYIYDMDSGLAQQMIDKFPFLARVRPVLERFERAAVRGSVGTLAVCRSLEDHARACRPDGFVARIEDVSLLAAPADTGDEVDDVPEGLIAMYVGNLQRYQGIDLLLEAFRHTVSDLPEARLVVIGGDEPSIAHYRRRCEDLGIPAAYVDFLGPRPVERLGAYLKRATVLVSPRIHGENTPMKIYSYLDSGRPVLATRLPTHTQVLTDDVARLVEPEPEPMGRALAELLRDRSLRERLAAAARDLTQREFTPQAFAGKLLRFYDSIEERIREERRDGQTSRLQAGHQGHR